MAITPSDVKLFESQRLTDNDDGGGRATGNVIVDGDINNLFPDISRLDRTIGDVALRKSFVGVATANADSYLGAHAILTARAIDPNVDAVLFNTGSESDERLQAQNRIESYVVRGTIADWFLLGTQYAGQRILIAFQDLTRDQPEVGDVFELVDGNNTQFVRLTSSDSVIETFIEEVGPNTVRYLERRKLTLSISAPLETNFTGGEPTLGGTSKPAASIHSTEVADAARYYGIAQLTAAASIGDLSVNVDSIFSSLVPSAQKEAIFVDQPGGYIRNMLAASAALPSNEAVVINYISSNLRFYTLLPILPGSTTVTISNSVYTDDGAGNGIHQSGTDSYTLSIDYAAGTVDAQHATLSGTTSVTVNYQPAVNMTGNAESGAVDVTTGNRSFSWTLNLAASKPRAGSLIISYMAQGKWQTLEDTGVGVLEGQGSGTVNFATGTVAMTFPVMPDVGTAIVYAYIANVAQEITHRSGLVTTKPDITIQLLGGVKPGSVTIAWNDGVARTATDNGAGLITGSATGRIVYATGEIVLQATSATLNITTELTIDYQNDAAELEAISMSPDGNGVVTGTLANAPILAGSLSFDSSVMRKILVPRDSRKGLDYTADAVIKSVITDDGAGGFIDSVGAAINGAIDYTTGVYTLTIESSYSYGTIIGTATGGVGNRRYTTASVYGANNTIEEITGATNIRYQLASASHGVQQLVRDATTLELRLLDSRGSVIPRSVMFTFGGDIHIDIDGVIYANPSNKTGIGTAVGSIDYTTGDVSLSQWPNGAGTAVNIITLTTLDASVATSIVQFRTPGKPLRPGSLQLTAVRRDTGALITVSADNAGLISSAEVSGYVDVETGLVQLLFTSDDTDITGASDIPIYPGSLRYNAVSYSYLPMDAALIGVDPVRLPGDGRVPIIRDGDVAVLAHTTATDIGTPTAAQVVTLARDHQADIVVVDSAGVLLDPAQYTVDLIAGTATFANPLTLQDAQSGALTAPLSIEDRIEHMTVISDTQISGELAMIAPVSHDYPAGSTLSSALLWGDIAARVLNEFTQKTWNSSSPNWTDNRIGDDTTASYNLIDYPIIVANNGAITENWALVFTGTTTFQIVGEQVGIIGTGSINTNAGPINPNTGQPYFTVDLNGWGTGWVAGNVLRFDTQGCLAPLWLARTVLSGQGSVDNDSVTIQVRGDAD